MPNLATGIFKALKFFFEKPVWATLFIIGILLMPLDVFDLLLFLFVNLFVAILNLIFWLLVFFVNLILIAINLGLDFLFGALSTFLGNISAPQLQLFDFEQQPFIAIDLFDPNTNLLILLLRLLG